jgi:hypothetical protein
MDVLCNCAAGEKITNTSISILGGNGEMTFEQTGPLCFNEKGKEDGFI